MCCTAQLKKLANVFIFKMALAQLRLVVATYIDNFLPWKAKIFKNWVLSHFPRIWALFPRFLSFTK